MTNSILFFKLLSLYMHIIEILKMTDSKYFTTTKKGKIKFK